LLIRLERKNPNERNGNSAQFFEDNSEIGIIRQEMILLHSSTEKVRRGVYAKVTSQQKQIDALKGEIEALKQTIGNRNEENSNASSDNVFALELCSC